MNRHTTFAVMSLLFASQVLSAAPASVQEAGVSIVVGDQDSAMGLTLTPWKEEFATGLDQPPSLYRPETSLLNDSSLQRQTEYLDNLSSYRRSHSQYAQ